MMDIRVKLRNKRVLIVEDEPFIALDLACAVEDAEGEPVGPAASVARALALIGSGRIDAAILDVDLVDGDSVPVLEALAKLGVPVIVHTGIGLPPEAMQRFPAALVQTKPTPAPVLVDRLTQLLAPPNLGC
jgi:DNA-binding NtrC family response regulator